MRKKSDGYPALAVIVVAAAGMLALPMSLGSAEVVVVGFADIGDVDLETGFILDGWGGPKVLTGSGWGGLEGAIRVVWAPGEDADENWAEITFPMPENFHGSLQTIYLRVLDGVADDSFKVSVCDTTRGIWNDIFYYAGQNAGAVDPNWAAVEVWKTHVVSLTDDRCIGDGEYDFPRGYPIYGESGFTIRITAMGAQWDYFASYGQLGVDWAQLEGNGVTL